MKTFELRITPDKAREFLSKNAGNRPVRSNWVETLAEMIRKGEWQTTHQGIAIDEDGNLLDGQHRLRAIISAGKAVDMLVTTGLPRSAFKHADCGRNRTPSDRIKLLNDEADNLTAVSIVRTYLLVAVVKTKIGVTVENTEHTFLEMANEVTAVAQEFRHRVPSITIAPVGAAIACYMTKHAVLARAFMRSLISGESLSLHSPVLTLREALLAKRMGTIHEQYWKSIQATKAHLDGTPLPRLIPAVVDWNENEYTSLAFARSNATAKANQTRKATKS